MVAIVAFLVSGIFLLALVPDRAHAAAEQAVLPPPQPAEVIAPPSAAPAPPTAKLGNGADLGAGGFAPLGGVGAPPRRPARHLPIERDGGTQFLSVDDVVAIHANAHYTFIFNGTDKLFCPLAIGEVESRLDNSRFVRIHRSHIVNIERVIGYKRSGDNEMVEMDAARDYAVPVSRSRIGWLKSRVAAVMGTESDTAQRRRHHLAPQ